MEQKYIKSPINYSGSKYRLIKKGLIDLFPKDIDTFVDLFCGACNVSFNVKANNIICNDYINYIPELFNCWKNKSLEDINKHIDKQINKWNLSPLNKDSFENFREYYNSTKNIASITKNCNTYNEYTVYLSNGYFYDTLDKESIDRLFEAIDWSEEE